MENKITICFYLKMSNLMIKDNHWNIINRKLSRITLIMR